MDLTQYVGYRFYSEFHDMEGELKEVVKLDGNSYLLFVADEENRRKLHNGLRIGAKYGYRCWYVLPPFDGRVLGPAKEEEDLWV